MKIARTMTLLILSLIIQGPVYAQDDPVIRGRTVSEWFRLLREESNAQRRLAILRLIDMEAGPNVPIVLPNFLKEVAVHPDPTVRARIIQALPRYKDRGEEIIQTYRSALTRDKESKVREAAAQTIPKLDRTGAILLIPDLGLAVRDAHPDVRAAAAQTIGILTQSDKQSTVELLSPLEEGLKDSEAAVRFQCAYALSQMGELAAPAVSSLAEMFRNDTVILNRREAAKAIAAIGPKAANAAETLVSGLADPQPGIRQAAALALAQVKGDPERVLPALLKAARDSDVSVRCLAIHAIGAFGKSAVKTIPDLIDILRRDEVADVRLAAIEELANFGPEARAALDVLKVASKDGRAAIREAAQAALKKIESSP